MDLGSVDDGSDIEEMGEERREREPMRFIRKAEVKSRVCIPTYAISKAHSIVSVLQRSVSRFVIRFFGYNEAAFKCQWHPLHVGASWISNICVTGRGQAESGRTGISTKKIS